MNLQVLYTSATVIIIISSRVYLSSYYSKSILIHFVFYNLYFKSIKLNKHEKLFSI